MRKKLGILGKKSLLPKKKKSPYLPISSKKVNICKKKLWISFIRSWFHNAFSCREKGVYFFPAFGVIFPGDRIYFKFSLAFWVKKYLLGAQTFSFLCCKILCNDAQKSLHNRQQYIKNEKWCIIAQNLLHKERIKMH